MKMTRPDKRTARALMVTALAVVGIVVVPAASAQAATGQCVLRITVDIQDAHVSNTCNPRAATDTIVRTSYVGDDPWWDYDDFLFDRRPTAFQDTFVTSKFVFNEDAIGDDEIYTVNVFRRTDGSSYVINSNVVSGSYSF